MSNNRIRHFLLRMVDRMFPPEMLGPVIHTHDEPPVSDDDTRPSRPVQIIGDWFDPETRQVMDALQRGERSKVTPPKNGNGG